MWHVQSVCVLFFKIDHDLDWPVPENHRTVPVQGVSAIEIKIAVQDGVVACQFCNLNVWVVKELFQKLVERHLKHFVGYKTPLHHKRVALVAVAVNKSWMFFFEKLSYGVWRVCSILHVFDFNTAIAMIPVVCMDEPLLLARIVLAKIQRALGKFFNHRIQRLVGLFIVKFYNLALWPVAHIFQLRSKLGFAPDFAFH